VHSINIGRIDWNDSSKKVCCGLVKVLNSFGYCGDDPWRRFAASNFIGQSEGIVLVHACDKHREMGLIHLNAVSLAVAYARKRVPPRVVEVKIRLSRVTSLVQATR
jgi:hypothetical protein